MGSTHGMGTCSLETFMMNWTHASFLWKALTRYWSVLKIFLKPKDKTERKKVLLNTEINFLELKFLSKRNL